MRSPADDVWTNEEQPGAVLRGQARVLASAVVLVALAAVAGVALTVNVLALLVHHQRRAFAALEAAGVSAWTLGGAVVWQGLAIAGLGAIGGLALTPAREAGLNLLA